MLIVNHYRIIFIVVNAPTHFYSQYRRPEISCIDCAYAFIVRIAYDQDMDAQEKKPVSMTTLERLHEGEKRGEIVFEKRTFFGPLPEIRLEKPAKRLDRIVKVAKR
jgi:hypothetical protein